tara:strand:- start:124 stop:429 length:306 start_codon:yes stop_codon:yes gene_type:complete
MLYKVVYDGEDITFEPYHTEEEVSSWTTERIQEYINTMQGHLLWKQRRVVEYSSWYDKPSMQTEEASDQLDKLIQIVREDVARTELSIKQAKSILEDKNND